MGKRKSRRKNPAGRSQSGKRIQSRRKQTKKRQAGTAVNSHYKDTVFRMLFREKDSLLSLYNSISGKHYTNPEELEIVTLENTVYLGMKNDLAFLIDFDLYLYEHQSTINPNMPFRFLQYVTDEYSKLTASDNLYGEKLVKITAHHFVVFYNGTRAYPEKQELRLSDAFQTREGSPELELRVQVLNINAGFNEGLKQQCRTLAEYQGQGVCKEYAYRRSGGESRGRVYRAEHPEGISAEEQSGGEAHEHL